MATKKAVTAQAGQAERTEIYEVSFNLVSTLPEEKLAGEFATIKEVIEKNGGAFISEEFPKLIPLAYEMTKVIDSRHQKYTQAYFGWVKFEMDPAMIGNVKTAVETNLGVLRHLIVKTVKENTIVGAALRMKDKVEAPVGEAPRLSEEEKAPVNEAEIDKSIDDLVTDIK